MRLTPNESYLVKCREWSWCHILHNLRYGQDFNLGSEIVAAKLKSNYRFIKHLSAPNLIFPSDSRLQHAWNTF